LRRTERPASCCWKLSKRHIVYMSVSDDFPMSPFRLDRGDSTNRKGDEDALSALLPIGVTFFDSSSAANSSSLLRAKPFVDEVRALALFVRIHHRAFESQKLLD